MKKFSVFFIVIAFSILFLACEEDAIPIPLPPPSQTTVNDPPAPVTEEKAELPVPAEKPKEPAKTAKAPAKEPPPAKTVVYYGSDDTEQLSKGRYIIQVAIFPAEASAKKLIKKLANDGIKAYNAKVQNPDPDKGMIGTYNRVRIGFFAAKANAEAFAKARLEPLGYAWWVDRSRNDNIGKLATYEPEEPFVVERIPEKTPKQMSEQEKREAERAAAIAAAKEEYKAIAKAANASVSTKAIPPPTVPPKAPKASSPPADKATAPKLAPPSASKTPPPAAKTSAPATAKTKKSEPKEAEIDSRGRVKMKSQRSS